MEELDLALPRDISPYTRRQVRRIRRFYVRALVGASIGRSGVARGRRHDARHQEYEKWKTRLATHVPEPRVDEKVGVVRVESAPRDTRTTPGWFESAGTIRRSRTDNDAEFADCPSNNGAPFSRERPPQELSSEALAVAEADNGSDVSTSIQARNRTHGARRVELSVGDGEGLGVAGRRAKTGVELAAAVEKFRASERR